MSNLFSVEEIRTAQKAAMEVGGLSRLAEIAGALNVTEDFIAIANSMRCTTANAENVTVQDMGVPSGLSKRTAKPRAKRAAKVTKTSLKTAPKPAGEKRPRAPKAAMDALKAQVLEQAQKLGAEFSSGELANQIGADRVDVARMLKKLTREGKIGMDGNRRNTRYHVVK